MIRNQTLTCRHEGCRRFAKSRGLCYVCYGRLQKRIRQGKLTWAEAEAQGLCLAARPKSEWMTGFRAGR